MREAEVTPIGDSSFASSKITLGRTLELIEGTDEIETLEFVENVVLYDVGDRSLVIRVASILGCVVCASPEAWIPVNLISRGRVRSKKG